MKTKFNLLTILVILFSISMTAQVNLLSNGNFEESVAADDGAGIVQDLKGWTGKELRLEGSTVITGTYCARFSGAAKAGYAQQTIDVTGETMYYFSCKAYVTENDPAATFKINVKADNGDWTALAESSATTVETLTGEYTTPAGATSLIVQFKKDQAIGYVDDCYVGITVPTSITKTQIEESKSQVFVNASKQLSISSDVSLSSYSIYNLSGQLIKQRQQLNAPTVMVNANDLSGLYIVNMKTVDGETLQHKVLVK